MSEIYKVSINKNEQYGYVAYDEANKKIEVVFPDAQVCKEVEDYLGQPHEINEPVGNSTINFEVKKYVASNSKHDLQIVLTRMWSCNQVHVNWSIPVEAQE